jgi:aminoglycoside phosphotransferase (APT) family kinase protein
VRNSAETSADELPKNLVAWVARTLGPGSRIQVVRRLPMGSWHLNHALTVVDGDGRVHRLVLRRWARLGWDRDDPDYTAAREMTILELLRPTPVPAPVLVGADIEGDECEVPTLLLTRLPGHPPTAADMAANRFCPDLAQTLAVVHDAGRALSGQLAPYRLYYDRAEATPPRWLTNTPVWQQAAAAVRAVPPAASQTMIHRDFHPENTLWSRGRLTGVVDWTQASWGPPGLDLGHMRWNLVLDGGQPIADRFLACYQALTGTSLDDQPYWDLVSLFDLLLDIDQDHPGDIDADDQRHLTTYVKKVLAVDH